MISIKEKHLCSGCTACVHSCPNSAIFMRRDSEGFYYPFIDISKCSECGLCHTVCPFVHNYNTNDNFPSPIVFAVKHKDDSIRFSSTSGGMFTALSDYFLKKKGVIFGCAFDKDFNVCHQKAEDNISRDLFKGSKYVQSELGMIFPYVKAELDKGRHVLFSGTPCQTAGLNAYLGQTFHPKLLLCDVVCYGTPSPLIWEDYLQFLLKTKKSKLKKFYFRHKAKGWHLSDEHAVFEDGSTIQNDFRIGSFSNIFFQRVAIRPSCHACVFTNLQRPSDITLGDFWGIEKYKPEFDDDKGVSLVLINTKKGEIIFDKIKNMLSYASSSVQECIQPRLLKSCEPSHKRNQFWIDYHLYGFEHVAKKYSDFGFFKRLRRRIIKPFLMKIHILGILKNFNHRLKKLHIPLWYFTY